MLVSHVYSAMCFQCKKRPHFRRTVHSDKSRVYGSMTAEYDARVRHVMNPRLSEIEIMKVGQVQIFLLFADTHW